MASSDVPADATAAVAGTVVAAPEELTSKISTVNIQEQEDPKPPAHRSHDPQYNQKRADPFQFGSRYLNQEDDVFEFNAWDHVETDDAFKEYAEQQYAMQRQSPVSDFEKSKFRAFLYFFTPATVMIYIKA